MYLKNIEVYGFKSFAQKINFEFHNGITGIVGPNGSGKSNVGDAVRWVLGEQSAKQLRGGNMQDVIFSGTENRKPLSFASVSITLDNSDHKLPVDYNEVTVTRRLYRSGESEYLINGSGCRLKDIQEMFYDTGIGKEGYSIIGQGQIDKILSGKPEERRELFDEAAGIVKFKRRKATTLKKLDEERQNLVRVTDILSELTKQLGPLEKQSETARIYLAKREELKELDVNLFLLDHQRTGELLKELEEKHGRGLHHEGQDGPCFGVDQLHVDDHFIQGNQQNFDGNHHDDHRQHKQEVLSLEIIGADGITADGGKTQRAHRAGYQHDDAVPVPLQVDAVFGGKGIFVVGRRQVAKFKDHLNAVTKQVLRILERGDDHEVDRKQRDKRHQNQHRIIGGRQQLFAKRRRKHIVTPYQTGP